MARRWLTGGAILVVAAALVIAILLGAKPVMTALMPHLSPAMQQNAPLMETVFNLIVFGTILVAALWARLFPSLRTVQNLGKPDAA